MAINRYYHLSDALLFTATTLLEREREREIEREKYTLALM